VRWGGEAFGGTEAFLERKALTVTLIGMTSLLAILAFAGLPLSPLARPDEEGWPFDFIRPVKGGKYVFVMLSPPSWRKNAYRYEVFADSSSSKFSSKDGLLFKKYPASGLYPNDGSKKALWTVDWYSFDVRACSDGVHLVRFGPWARSGDDGKTPAVAFYRSGKEIRSYLIRDLVSDYEKLPHSVSHYQWMRSNSFDDAGKRVKVLIFQGYDYGRTAPAVFDITTGEKEP